MPLSGKKILLAGSTGLAGSAILKRLLEDAPSATIRATSKKLKPFLINKRVEYIQGDLASPEECRRMVTGCDYVIMAAAHTSGAGISSSQPWELVNANLIMNATLLQAAAEAGIRRLVLVGSATLYQLFDGYISEDQLDLNQDPPDAYMGVGWVTRYIEKLCAFWHKQSDMDIVMVRASNIFGSYAQFDPKTSNFIPALIRKAVDRMDPFEVWGNPQVTRDVIYSDDFARAVVLMLEREDIQFDVFNIATGIKTTVGEVVEWVLKSAGHVPSRISYNDQLPKTAPFRALDCSKAQTILGWKPEVSVEQGIKQTVQWWQQNRDCWNR